MANDVAGSAATVRWPKIRTWHWQHIEHSLQPTHARCTFVSVLFSCFVFLLFVRWVGIWLVLLLWHKWINGVRSIISSMHRSPSFTRWTSITFGLASGVRVTNIEHHTLSVTSFRLEKALFHKPFDFETLAVWYDLGGVRDGQPAARTSCVPCSLECVSVNNNLV